MLEYIAEHGPSTVADAATVIRTKSRVNAATTMQTADTLGLVCRAGTENRQTLWALTPLGCRWLDEQEENDRIMAEAASLGAEAAQ